MAYKESRQQALQQRLTENIVGKERILENEVPRTMCEHLSILVTRGKARNGKQVACGVGFRDASFLLLMQLWVYLHEIYKRS